MTKQKFFASRDDKITPQEIAHAELAGKLAGECMVLLENDGVLPLQEKGKIALYGNGVRKTIQGGTGSGSVNTRSSVNVEQGFEEAGFTVVSKAWLDANDKHYVDMQEAYQKWLIEEGERTNVPPFVVGFNCPFAEPDPYEISEEEIAGCEAEVAVYVISRNSGEGADRKCKEGDYLLYPNERESIKRLAASDKKLVVVLNIGGVMQLTELKEIQGVDAVVLMSQLGNLGGNALVDLLTGKVNPSGKLSDTWARDYQDYPSSANFSHNNGNVDDEYYNEGVYVGYRYFDSFGVKPLYPFGYGLSYTGFSVEPLKVEQEGDKILVSVQVKNTGSRYTGKEVVQVYLSKPQSSLDNPYQELVAFKKTMDLKPGEDTVLCMSFPLTALASYHTDRGAYIVDAGDYIIRVGQNAADTQAVATLTVAVEKMVSQCENVFPLDCKLEEIKPVLNGTKEETKWNLAVDLDKLSTTSIFYTKEHPQLVNAIEEKITMQDVLSGKYTLDELVAQLTVKEMAELCVGTERRDENSIVGSASYCVPGAAGDSSSVIKESRGVKNMILADGPAGLRLQPHFMTDKDGNILPGGEGFNGTFLPFKDVPEGAIDYYQYCTAIPIGWALAQSWNTELVEKVGQVIGEEMKQFNVDLWLAPAMNIHRNPLCGRNFEYYSEDPLLTGKISAAMTNGVQKNPGKGTTIKHFAVNNQEENRYFTNAHVSERALREIYLKGFEIAIRESQPMSIMTSYNLLNGTHTANNYDLIQKMARDEWGFDGVVMTDWYTSVDVPAITGKYTPKYPISASTGCIYAGNDMQMPGCQKNVDDIVEAVQSGEEKDGYKITLADLQFCAKNVLHIVAKTMKA